MSLVNLDSGLEKLSSSKPAAESNNKFNDKSESDNKHKPNNKFELLKKDEKDHLIYF